jgi:transposase
LSEDLFPPESAKRSRGMPHVPFRYVPNTLLYILITGCRWCDVPQGEQRSSGSSAHRWLKRWEKDGISERLKARVPGIADENGLINRESGAVDGSFSPGKGGGEGVRYGRKGKGILIHTVAERNGMPMSCMATPANTDERAAVLTLPDDINPKTGKVGRPRKRIKVPAGDKGYDSRELRKNLRKRGIRPQLPGRIWGGKRKAGRPIKNDAPRFQVERTFSWLQRRYRRLVIRWERIESCFQAFLNSAFIHIWLKKISVG